MENNFLNLQLVGSALFFDSKLMLAIELKQKLGTSKVTQAAKLTE